MYRIEIKAFELKRNDSEYCKLVIHMNARHKINYCCYSKHLGNNVNHTLNRQNKTFSNL